MARTVVSTLSSPTNRQHQLSNAASAAEKAKWRRVPPHHPSADSPVFQLSDELSIAGKVWWNKYIGKEFLSWKKNRGDKEGAKGKVSTEDKIWYFDKTDIGTQIYSYINNTSTRGAAGRTLPVTSTALKSRAYGHDDWRRENIDIFKDAVEEWKEANGGQKPNVGEACALSARLFQQLPENEQEKWQDIAQKRLAANRAGAKITDPDDHVGYVKGFKKALDDLITEGDTMGGIQVCAMILFEKPDGTLKIERHISKELREFGKTQSFGDAMIGMQKWVEAAHGKKVEGGPPPPCVYLVHSKDGYPGMPNSVGWKLEALQGLIRHYVNFVIRSTKRAAWTEISEDPLKYIDAGRLPDGLVHEFGDPHTISRATVVALIDYFLSCHTGQVPEHKVFQLRLIFAGNQPIHPDDSQEKTRKYVEGGAQSGWVLEFDRTVTKCHNPKGMGYSQAAHDYADFVANGLEEPVTDYAPPARWMELPVPGPDFPDQVILATEFERYSLLASLLPESTKSRIIALLDAAKNHQHHVPVSDSRGVYASELVPPRAIPSKPNSCSTHGSMWLPQCYFQPLRTAPPEGTVEYFEEWQEALLESKVLHHDPSNSLAGGDNGVVWVVRTLIDLDLNFAAVCGDFKPPEDHPVGYDLTRLPVNGWSRLLGWVDRWTEEINASVEILSASSDERHAAFNKPALRLASPDLQETVTTGTSKSVTPAPDQSGQHRKRSSNKKSSSKGQPRSRRDDLIAGPESDDEEIDWETRDITSQDGNGNGDDGVDWESWLVGQTQAGSGDAGTGAGTGAAQAISTGSENWPEIDTDASESDRLDLRLRYGFTRENTYMDAEGNESGAVPDISSHSSGNWSVSEAVFGRFLELPAYQKAHFYSAHTLVRQIRMFDSECADTLTSFKVYLEEHPQVTPSILESASAEARDHPTHVQPFYQILFVHPAVWKRTKTIAQGVHGHAQRLALVMREGLCLYSMAENAINHAVFPDPAVTGSVVAEAVNTSKRWLVEVGWTLTELQAFQKLSTDVYNRFEAHWMKPDVPTDTATLVRVVQDLVDWTTATTKQASTLQLKRKAVWKSAVCEPFRPEHSTSGMLYRFGCPIVAELPAGLQDALAAVSPLISGTTDLAGSTTTDRLNKSQDNSCVQISSTTPVGPAVVSPTVPLPNGDSGAPASTYTDVAGTTTALLTTTAAETTGLTTGATLSTQSPAPTLETPPPTDLAAGSAQDDHTSAPLHSQPPSPPPSQSASQPPLQPPSPLEEEAPPKKQPPGKPPPKVMPLKTPGAKRKGDQIGRDNDSRRVSAHLSGVGAGVDNSLGTKTRAQTLKSNTGTSARGAGGGARGARGARGGVRGTSGARRGR